MTVYILEKDIPYERADILGCWYNPPTQKDFKVIQNLVSKSAGCEVVDELVDRLIRDETINLKGNYYTILDLEVLENVQ